MSENQTLQTIRKILEETNVSFDENVVSSLYDFVNNYASSVLKEAKNCAPDSNHLTKQDIKCAVQQVSDRAVFSNFEKNLKMTKKVNSKPLPDVASRSV